MSILFYIVWILWGLTIVFTIYLLGENYLLRRYGKKLLDELDKIKQQQQIKIIDTKVVNS